MREQRREFTIYFGVVYRSPDGDFNVIRDVNPGSDTFEAATLDTDPNGVQCLRIGGTAGIGNINIIVGSFTVDEVIALCDNWYKGFGAVLPPNQRDILLESSRKPAVIISE